MLDFVYRTDGDIDDDRDGYRECDGDCDDADPTSCPGAPELCDGVDNDCDGSLAAFEQDGDLDGLAACLEDCDDGNPDTDPGAPEVNDGQDNQCPGNPGHGLIDEISGTAGFSDPLDAASYSWTAQAGATLYEVARSSSPDFSAGCSAFATVGPAWTDPSIPAAGAVLHYLIPALAPSTGSWGADSVGLERVISCAP